jgi:hypothetical protein
MVGSLLIFLLAGCANTVTQKIIAGDNISLKVTFKANFDLSNYYYLLVFSNGPLPLFPNRGNYFVAPGQLYDAAKLLRVAPSEGINYFYKNFYCTWSDYIILTDTGFYLFNSGNRFSISTTEATHYNYKPNQSFNPTNLTKADTIQISFPLYYLSNMSSYMYFSAATCSKENAKMNNALDTIQFMPQIKLEAITEKKGDEQVDTSLPAAVDIIHWEVRIY